MKAINHQKGLHLIALVSIFALVIFAGCKKESTTPGPNEVWMQNTAFVPATLNVGVNTTVTWTNKDGMDHNVTSNDGSFVSGTIAPNGTYTHQFTTSGTFSYRCTIHQNMTGTIVVK